MARRLPFRVIGQCIDCAGDIEPGRSSLTWRCLACRTALMATRSAAQRAIVAAIRKGDMPRADALNCIDCSGPARDYDHRDYSQPLTVDPVCQLCNTRRGPALPLNQQPAQA